MADAEPEHLPRQSPERYEPVEPSTAGKLRVLRIGDVELRIDSHTVRIGGHIVNLPAREFQVLRVLMDNAGRVLTRRELLNACWGPDHPDNHNKTLEVHINRIRRKIRTASRASHIRTVYGTGYIFDLPD
ncbi:MAG: winged helix-turn-helix transcriptional regulator [Pseudonocardia sp.]|nr:winged helix-turn-helix transcriptional regulator [Pseudonocardia sp.]